MIGGMRKFARSKWALVVLFIPLVISLAMFLPNDFTGGLSGGTLTKIGNREIKVQEVEADLQRAIDRIRVEQNRVLSQADAVREGVAGQLINELDVRNTLLAYADKVGIQASDAAVGPYLIRNKIFLDEFGRVSTDAIAREAANRRQTTREFEGFLRDFLTQDYIREAAGSALSVPKIMSQPWINYLGESRTFSLAQVTASTAPAPAAPTDAELQTWYDAHTASFQQPERRRISVLTYSPDDFLDKVEITEEELRAKYQERIRDYSTAETRTYTEYQGADRNTVQAFIDLVMQGMSAEAALAQSPNITPKEFTVKPEEVANEEFREFLFSIPKDQVHSIPIPPDTQDSGLPFRTVKVTAVTPGVATPYEQIADKVRRDVTWMDAVGLFEASAEPFRDAAGGQSLEDIAKQFGIPLVTLAPIDAQGRTQQGEQAQIMTQNADAMRQLFTLSAGDMTNVFEGENVRTMFRLDEVVAPYTLPLAEVKDQVRNEWMREKVVAVRRKAADDMAAAVKAGTAFEKAAADAKLTALPSLTLIRAANTPIDPAVLSGAFELKAGETGVVVGQDGNPWVARVEKIEPVTPEVAETLRAQLGQDVAQSILQDINETFIRGLRAEIDYKRDDAAIQAYLQRLVGDSETQ